MVEEDVEFALITIDNTMVFQVPPITEARGHCAASWKPYFKWKGCMTLLEKGKSCSIDFNEADGTKWGGGRIAFNQQTKSIKSYIDKCYDSLRFFSITLINPNGQKANIGVGWDDRNVAFNFFNAIDKFERHINMETDADLPKDLPMADFSLKEGEKVSIGLVETQKEQPKKKMGGGLGMKLGKPTQPKVHAQKIAFQESPNPEPIDAEHAVPPQPPAENVWNFGEFDFKGGEEVKKEKQPNLDAFAVFSQPSEGNVEDNTQKKPSQDLIDLF